ncbi:MAG: cell division protein FtsZ, partial [Oryzihumus sp.]
ANIIFGAVIDDALGDEVRVTVIAAGFDGGGPIRRTDDRALGQIAGSTQRQAPPVAPRPAQPPVQQQPVQPPAPQTPRSEPTAAPQPAPVQPERVEPRVERPEPVRTEQEQPARPPRTVTFDDSDDLDVPDFLK